MYRNFIWILFLIISLGVSAQDVVSETLNLAIEFYDAGEYRKSQRELSKLFKSKQTSEIDRTSGLFLQAKNYAKLQQTRELERSIRDLEKLSDFPMKIYYFGDLYLAMGKTAEAIDASKKVMALKEPIFILNGNYLRSHAEFELKRYEACMSFCKDYLKLARSLLKETNDEPQDEAARHKTKQENSYAELLKKPIKIIEALHEKARDEYEAERYGIDYVHYRKGRLLQFNKKWKNAIEAYNKVVMPGILKEASGFYSIQCMGLAGNDLSVCSDGNKNCKIPPWRHALKMYEDFIVENPKRLYCEEAYIGIAELLYRYGTNNADTKKALNYIDTFIMVLDELNKEEFEPSSLSSLNKNIMNDLVYKNPKQFAIQNDVGQLVRTLQRPESIINRHCAPWYSLEQETRAWLLKGFLLGQLDDKIAASKAYEKAGEIGLGKILCDNNSIKSLLAGLCDSSYMLPKNIKMNKLRKSTERLLPFTAYLYITERNKEAMELMKLLERYDKKRPSEYEYLTLKLVEAQILFSEGKRKNAQEILEKLHSSKTCKRLPHWPMNAYLYANLLGASGQKKKAFEVYNELIANTNKKSEYAPLSMLAFAIYATNCGEKELAIDMCSRLMRRYSKTDYKYAAKTLRIALRKSGEKELITTELTKDADENEEENDTDFTPRILTFNQLMIIPDSKKWKEYIADFKKSDLVLYSVRLINRDNCSIVKSVAVTHPLDEPQVPSAKGNLLTYVRIPYLFDKSLRYDFKNAFAERRNVFEPTVNDDGEFIDDEEANAG